MFSRSATSARSAVQAARLVVLIIGLIPFSLHAQGFQIPKPSPGLMPNPSLGKVLYEKNCAACHGIDLAGTADKGPPLVHRVYEPSHHSDAAFQLAVKNGVRAHHWKFGDMAPVPGLTPDDVAHTTAYVRMAQRKVGIQ